MDFEEIVCYSQTVLLVLLAVGYLLNLRNKDNTASSKIEFMRSLLQEFPSISEAISQELRMSVDQMDDFFGSMLGEERKTLSAREQMEASPEQPIDQMQPPVNEVDRMLQAGRGQEQPLI